MNPAFTLTLISATGVIGVLLFVAIIVSFAKAAKNLHSMESDQFGEVMSKFVMLSGMLFLDFVAFCVVMAVHFSNQVPL